MNKKLLYVLLAINSAYLWASDKDANAKKTVLDQTTLEKITPNKRSYTDLVAQVALNQPAKQSQLEKRVDSRTQAEKDAWDQRTALQKYLMTPNEHDRLHVWPQDHAHVEKSLSPARALSSDESDYCASSPAYKKEPKNSFADQHEQWCEYHDRSESCDACTVPTYFWGYGRDGNDSE